MAPDRTQVTTDAAAPDGTLNRSYVDWAAIAGGTVVAAAIGTVFAAFGAALGLTALSPIEGEGNGTLALLLTATWMIVTLVSSYAAGGYIAGRMRRRVDAASADEVTTRDGMNGLIVWGTGILLSAMVVSNLVSATVGAAGSAVGTAVEATGTAVGGAVGGIVQGAASLVPDDAMTMAADSLLRPAQVSGTDTADTARQTTSILGSVLTTGEISDTDRAYLVSATAARTGLTPAEVETRVDAAVANTVKARADAAAALEEAEKTAREAADTARKGAVLTGFLLAAAALVAAAAAFIGAVKGGEHRDEGKVFGGFRHRRPIARV